MRDRLAPGMIVGGRFQVEAAIGRGDNGEVHRVKDPRSGLSYALKLFTSPAMRDAQASGAFERASRQAGQLGQEFVGVQELGMDPNGPFALSAVVSPRPLDRTIEKKGPLPLEETVEWLATLGASLDRAHGTGVVHGDLKPQNVFYGSGLKGPVVRITDFGAIFLRMAAPAPWPGAYGWCAPEQVGGAPLSSAMDVYAMGLLTFYSLVGRPIFFSLKLPTPEPTRLWEEMHTLPAPSERAAELGGVIPPALDDVLRRALSPQPAERQASVSRFIGELRHHAQMASQGVSAPPARLQRPPGPIAPPALISSGSDRGEHGTQVLDLEELKRARAIVDAENAVAAPPPVGAPPPVVAPPVVAAPPPVVAPPPVAAPPAVAAPPPVGVPPPVVAPPVVAAPPPVVAPPPAVAAPPPVGAPPPVVAPPPVAGQPPFHDPPPVAAPSLVSAPGASGARFAGTMVADASEAFAMLESMAAAPPPPVPGPGVGPAQPELVRPPLTDPLAGTRSDTGLGQSQLGQSQPGALGQGPLGQSRPGALGQSQLGQSHLGSGPGALGVTSMGQALPPQRRDATLYYTPPSDKNHTKLIVIVVAVVVLLFVIGGLLIGWALSLDDAPLPEHLQRVTELPGLTSGGMSTAVGRG
ncbi:MAG: serine/threonine protein kinase [Polyangiaceae bacterium]|nr:serine/threonine protein kinase [Polyangiaceae bacterium]MCW5789222.1 serine/threonine protein kinase [Polyangiaceae bacterium]